MKTYQGNINKFQLSKYLVDPSDSSYLVTDFNYLQTSSSKRVFNQLVSEFVDLHKDLFLPGAKQKLIYYCKVTKSH